MESLGRGESDPSPQSRLQEEEQVGVRQSLRGLLQFVRTAILGNRENGMSHHGQENGVSQKQRGIKVPEFSRTFGPLVNGPIVMNKNPAGATQAEIDDQALIREAVNTKDRWVGEPPELY